MDVLFEINFIIIILEKNRIVHIQYNSLVQ